MATPRKGTLYPECDHYKHFTIKFERRLISEGGMARLNKVRKARLKYKEKTKVSRHDAWVWAIFKYPPIGAAEMVKHELGLPGGKSKEEVVEDLKKKGITYKNKAGWESYKRFVSFDQLKNVDQRELHNYMNWADLNANCRGVKVEDAPHPLAFSLLRLRQTNPENFKEFRTANSKSKTVATAVEADWMRDDQELQGILERIGQGPGATEPTT